MAELDPYGTHLAVLLAAVAATDGPVLECGAGHYSTALLHALCAPRRRRLFTLEAKADWLAQFAPLACDWHRLEACSWLAFPWADLAVDVALVDQDAHRAHVLRALRGRARLVVTHDTEACCSGYGDAFEVYDWTWTYQRYTTWASLSGMGERPGWIEEALPPGAWGVPRCYR